MRSYNEHNLFRSSIFFWISSHDIKFKLFIPAKIKRIMTFLCYGGFHGSGSYLSSLWSASSGLFFICSSQTPGRNCFPVVCGRDDSLWLPYDGEDAWPKGLDTSPSKEKIIKFAVGSKIHGVKMFIFHKIESSKLIRLTLWFT